MCKEKSRQLLAEELFYRTKDAGEELESAELARADAFCEEYKTFLNHAKVEREADTHHGGDAGKSRLHRL